MVMIVQKRCDAGTTVRFLRRLLKNQHVEPEFIVTDGLRSYGAVLSRLGLDDRRRPGRLRDKIRAENLHLSIRRRERKVQGFRSRASAQRFLEMRAAVYSTFKIRLHRLSRLVRRVLRARSEVSWSSTVAQLRWARRMAIKLSLSQIYSGSLAQRDLPRPSIGHMSTSVSPRTT
jgi:putative transposase